MQKQGIKLKDKSTLSKREYWFDHLLYGAILAFDIYNIFPYFVPIAKYNNSIPRLIICMLLTGMFGILFSYNYNRSGKGVVQDILLGIGSYTVLTIGKYAFSFIRWLGVGLFVISLLGVVRIIAKRIRRTDRKKQIIISRLLRSTQVVRRNAGVCAAIVIIALPIALKCFPNDKLNEDYYAKVCEEYGLNVEDVQDGMGISEYDSCIYAGKIKEK